MPPPMMAPTMMAPLMAPSMMAAPSESTLAQPTFMIPGKWHGNITREVLFFSFSTTKRINIKTYLLVCFQVPNSVNVME